MTTILPANGSPWPPSNIAHAYGEMPRRLAWLKGSRHALQSVYRGGYAQAEVHRPATTLNPEGSTVTVGKGASAFWAEQTTDESSLKSHLPIAQDIATTSSELLFSDPPQVKVIGPVDAEGAPTVETKAAQLALEKALDKIKFQSLLLAAAEISSALGYTGLRIAFDKSMQQLNVPFIVRADANTCVPVYAWGQLVGVLFWRVIGGGEADAIYRHIEAHQDGKVYHALYKGDGSSIGSQVPLGALGEAQPALLKLAPALAPDGSITLDPDGGKTATSIPNMLPDPEDLESYAGRSDYTPAVMDLMDNADRVYSQMMESIDDAKSRILIGSSMLETKGAGKGATFDGSQRIFTKLNLPPADQEGKGLPIDKVQFEMHIVEYLTGVEALRDRAIDSAGYSSNARRDSDGSDAVTATQVVDEGRKSMSTRDKKVRYWDTELEDLLTTYLKVYVAEFAPDQLVPGEDGAEDVTVKVQAFPVQVTFPDAVQPSISENASTALTLSQAKGAASFYTLVQTVHPDWTDSQIRAELVRIEKDSTPVDPITFGASGAGVGPGDSQLANLDPTQVEPPAVPVTA